LPEHLHPTNWVVSESIDFLRRRDPCKPFFLWMSFVRPHPPFDPPQSFFDMYVNDETIPKPAVGEWAETEDPGRRGLNPNTSGGLVEWKQLRRAMAAYYALITHIDNQIGRFLIALREHGLADNTLVVFTSDHGEMLGDHNLYRKSLPYEGSANVPLLISDLGGRLGLKKGAVVDLPVELRDIMPTLLAAAGAEAPASVEGSSLLPLARQQDIEWREYIHGEHPDGKLSNQYLTDGREKYIWFSQTGREQLFNLREDRGELRNLADDPQWAERLRLWRGRLIKELEGREEGYTDGRELIVGRKPRGTLSRILTRD
jgi:arylsulfatase A-like enzyme